MVSINPYLNFPGNTEEAFNFYKSVFGGEFLGGIRRFTEAPNSDKMLKDEQRKVMHIALAIGSGNVIMGTDALESMGQKVNFGNNLYICISPENKEEADKLFNGLSADGKIEMPLEEAFWGAYFGAFTDKFGVQWMINYEKK